MSMDVRLFVCGLGVWIAATIGLRLAGQYLLRPGDWTVTLLLVVVSFPAMACLVRLLCRSFRLPREQWLTGAVSLALPTLLLDPFACVFFPAVFPNMAPEMAGVFGGWMLWCCAGALVGAILRPGTPS
jgi:hypothetical protein